MSDSEKDTDSVSLQSDTDSGTDDEIEATEEERLEIRERISSLSFEDLLKMKEEMGSKLYNKTIFGETQNKRIRDFKRANKNRPRELSSKIKFKDIKKQLTSTAKPKTFTPRDPRFDPVCGEFDMKTFQDNYKFVNDMQLKEKTQLEKELRSCSDVERKKTLKLLIQRLDSKIKDREKKNKKDNETYQEKQEIKEKLKKGQKPVYKKKSVKKLESLIEKYEGLKKTNKLQKHIKMRFKKLDAKEKKKMI